MASYEEARVKLTNTQPKKIKSAAKDKTGTTLRITKKTFQAEELPHELFLTTRQKTKMRNAFTNKMSTDIKISKSQLTKIIQSGRFLGKTLGILGEKILLDLAVPFTKDVLLKLVTETTSSVLDKSERKIRGKGAVREKKGFTLLISNEDIDDIIKIVESLEKSSPLIDGVTETVKHKIKKQEGGFLGAMVEAMAASLKGPMACSLIQPAAS